ncbi:hypothetical protein Gotur_014543 [Gossypium turneri]
MGKIWVNRICRLPIENESQRDRIVWCHNPHCCFTLKSAYSWLLFLACGFFSWRVGHELLPRNVKIASIRNGFDQGCPRCGVVAEALIHTLKDYPISRELVNMMRSLDKRAMADLMTTLWNYWNNRNNFMFKGKEDKANLSKDFRIYNILNEPLLSQNEAIKKWEKPPKGVVKINFDASINVNKMGYGMIIRDDDGFVLGGGGGFIDKRVLVHEVECNAFERSIELACQLNINGDVLFETDHAGLVNKMRNYGMDVSIIGAGLRNVKMLSTTSSLPT